MVKDKVFVIDGEISLHILSGIINKYSNDTMLVNERILPKYLLHTMLVHELQYSFGNIVIGPGNSLLLANMDLNSFIVKYKNELSNINLWLLAREINGSINFELKHNHFSTNSLCIDVHIIGKNIHVNVSLEGTDLG